MAGIGLGSLAVHPFKLFDNLPEFPLYERLGRVTVGMVELKARPDQDSQTLGPLYEDAVVPWLREVVGHKPYYINQRWVETPDGYLYGPNVQPVWNRPNQPVSTLQPVSMGEGMWAEVTVPYTETTLETGPSSNSWVRARMDEGLPVRLYYGQVFWIDRIDTDDSGQVYYRVNPNYYGGLDMLWVPAESMRPITAEEISPISPEAENKRVVVDITRQTLSCLEGEREVYYCRISTGAKFDMYGNAVDRWATPIGTHLISRKFISLQMAGGTTGASYDLPGIGWTSIFVTGGVAVHATVWHNDYGTPRSHGCVNARPEDAKWVFRWTLPSVAYDPGMVDVTISDVDSTIVQVIES